MKKVLLIVAVLLTGISTKAQTQEASIVDLGTIGENVFRDIWTLYMPPEFGTQHRPYFGVRTGDSMVVFNSDIQRVKTLHVPEVNSPVPNSTYWPTVCRPLYLKDGVLQDHYLFFTQTLFNTDNLFEFLLPQYGGMFVCGDDTIPRIPGINVVNEVGDVVNAIHCAENESFWALNAGYMWIVVIEGRVYMNIPVVNSQGGTLYRCYRVDRQAQKIEPVAEMPFSVRPTVMERGQDIVVELDEGSNAREIEVVNTLGQTVRRVPVEAGQRELRINTSDFGSGMNFITTRTREGQGTVKIIVR